MGLAYDTILALQMCAVLIVREYPIGNADGEHLDSCPARGLDLSQLYLDMPRPKEIITYLTNHVQRQSNYGLTVRTANPELFLEQSRNPDTFYLAVCNSNTPPDTVVSELTDDMRLVMLTPTYGGLKLHALAA